MESESEDEFKKYRKEWLRCLANEYIKLEARIPVGNFLPEEDSPKWVQNLEREVGATMFPAAKLKEKLELTPHRLAAIIGHNCAIAVWLMEWLEDIAEHPQSVDNTRLTPEQIEQSEAFWLSLQMNGIRRCGGWQSAV